MTQAEVAAHLDLNTRSVRDLRDRGVIDLGASLDEIRVAYIRALRAEAARHIGANGLDLAGERAKLANAQTQRVKLELAQRRGQVMPAADNLRSLVGLATLTTGHLRSIASKLGAKLAAESRPAACEELVRGAIDEALHDLADAGRDAGRRLEEGQRRRSRRPEPRKAEAEPAEGEPT